MDILITKKIIVIIVYKVNILFKLGAVIDDSLEHRFHSKPNK